MCGKKRAGDVYSVAPQDGSKGAQQPYQK